MVPLAVSSMFFHEYSLTEIFSYVSTSGLDGMEFWIETPDFWLRDLPVGEVIACSMKHPRLSSLTVHAPILDLNPCSINPDVAKISVQHALRAVAITGQVGARILTIHPGRRTAKRPVGAADFARFDHYLAALREAALKSPVRICMENMEPSVNSLLCTPERVRQLLDDEPWLSFTLDVAHALVRSEDEPMRYLELCGDRIANVHISRVNGRIQHLPLDRDRTLAGFLHALRDAGYAGPLTLEIDDLNLPAPCTAEEKIAILKRDRAFMAECLQ